MSRVPLGVSAQTASRASGASLPAAPASVTAMQTAVTPTLASVESAGTTQLDTSVNVVWMGSLETQYLAQGSIVGPALALVILGQIILTATPAMLTTHLTRSSATANKATQDHAATNVPLATMATQSNLEGSASHASAIGTLTPRIPSPVIPGLVNA